MTAQVHPPGAPRLWRLGDGPAPRGAHVALVPGAAAPMLTLDLPTKLAGAARETVATRQLADTLSLQSTDLEMHAFHPNRAKSWNAAVVVAAGDAARWRDQLAASTKTVLPDYLALPAAEGLWTIETTGEKMRARLGLKDGFSAEIGLGVAQLGHLEKPRAILRLGERHSAVETALSDLGVPVHTDPSDLRKAGIRLANWQDAVGKINLGHPPSGALGRARATLKAWTLPVVAACLGFSVWMATVWIETDRAQNSAAVIRAETETLVRAHFIPNGPLLDIRAQVQPVLDKALEPPVLQQTGIPPLTQFQIAATSLTRDGTRIARASYRAQTGLEIDLETADFSALDALVIDLQDAGYLVEQLDSSSRQSGGVTARLRLELLE